MRAVAVAVLLACVVVGGVRAQGPVQRAPQTPKITAGAELYKFYCSNCHGMDAKGRPATVANQKAAPNLTVLALGHGGVFPREAVRDVVVKGSGPNSAHGTAAMPVWGTIFRAFEPNDTMVEVRVDNLIRYLESVQVSGAGTHDAQ